MSFPHYESYKDSGVEWVGDLPSSWSVNKIKFNTYVKGRVGWHGLNSNEFSDVGVHLVTGTDFENGFVSWDRCYRISEERYIEDPYIQLKENDLLITKDGTIGKLARVKGLPGRASLNSGIFLVRAKDETYLEDFLYWVLQSSLFNNFMDLHKVGSTIQHLYQEVFNKFTFPIPAKSEQQTITVFLDRETAKIDELIAEQQRLIELLKEKRQAVISNAVTKGLKPDAPMKDSGIEWLGEVPAHWDVKKIKFLLKKNGLVRGPFGGDLKKEIFVDDGIKVYEQKNAIYKDFRLGDSYISELKFSEMSRFTVYVGDYIMSCSGTIGRAYRIPKGAPVGIINQALLIIRFNETVISGFTDWIFNADFFQLQILDNSQGGAMKNLVGMDVFTSIGLPVPPIEEQKDIDTFLNRETAKLDELNAEAQHGITLLQERRTALISAAVTGKIDVRRLVNIPSQTEAA